MKDKKELSKVISALTTAVNELNAVIAEDDEDTFEPAFAEPAAEDEIEIVDDTPEDADSEEKIEIVDDEDSDEDADKEKTDEGLGDLLNPLTPVKTVGKIVGGIGNAIGGIGESKEECEDGDCDKEACDEGIGSAVLGGLAMGAASAVGNKVAGKILGEKDCDEEFEDDEVDEGLLNLLNPLAPVKAIGGAVKGLFGEECEDCEEGSKKEAALNEARIADLEDKFGFRLGLKTAYQLFYRNAYILIEPSEVAYDKGCRVIYVDDDQMICLYDEANDVDLYSSYVESDVEVDSQIRQIFQSHLDLYIDEIGDVRVVKGRYHV